MLLDELADKEQRKFEGKQLNNDEDTLLFLAADSECEVCNREHQPIIAGYCDIDLNFYQFTGPNCIRQMFDSIAQHGKDYDKIIVEFHHLKYNWSVMASFLITS